MAVAGTGGRVRGATATAAPLRLYFLALLAQLPVDVVRGPVCPAVGMIAAVGEVRDIRRGLLRAEHSPARRLLDRLGDFAQVGFPVDDLVNPFVASRQRLDARRVDSR